MQTLTNVLCVGINKHPRPRMGGDCLAERPVVMQIARDRYPGIDPETDPIMVEAIRIVTDDYPVIDPEHNYSVTNAALLAKRNRVGIYKAIERLTIRSESIEGLTLIRGSEIIYYLLHVARWNLERAQRRQQKAAAKEARNRARKSRPI